MIECSCGELDTGDAFQVFARTPEDLNSGTAVLKSSIVDVHRDISPENEQTVTSKKFQEFIDQLKKDYAGEMLFKLGTESVAYGLIFSNH